MPKISIVTPAYNRSNMLKVAVESVLRQSYTGFEIIIIDDGSTDDTHDVIKQIGDGRIRYFYKKNGGVATARNLGISKAKGQYLAFLESDDIWPENFLMKMLGKLENKPDYGGVYSLFKDRYSDGREIVGFQENRYMSGRLTQRFFEQPPFIIPSATLFRRSIWDNFWWDEVLRSSDDIDAFLRLSVRTMFLCEPGVCVVRKITSDSLTTRDDVNLSPKAVLIYERFYFQLGGGKIVPRKLANRWFNRLYRGLAKAHCKAGNRAAAIWLFKKAISYYPFDRHDYRGLLRSLLLTKKADSMSDWQMPKPLPAYVTAFGRKSDSV